MTGSNQLLASAGPLIDHYDMALLDLDGVVYLLGEPIPGAPQTIARLREAGIAPRFVTNNASRRAGEVAELLTSRGIDATPQEVCTSAQAAAAILREHCEPGSPVLVVGSEALAAEVAEAGLRPVTDSAHPALAAVVQGFGSGVGWPQLSEAAVLVRAGLFWVATNTDQTMPSPRGPLPGNGTMVQVVATAAGRRPDAIAGKPEAALLLRAIADRPNPNPIMVGDRWDTDIEAAHAAGMPSMLVLSGSTRPAEVLSIPAHARPNYLAWTVAGLCEPHPAVIADSSTASCEGWRATAEGVALTLTGHGETLNALRVLSELGWRRRSGGQGNTTPMTISAGNDDAGKALDEMELGS